MKKITIDTSGLSCPSPVILVLEEIERGSKNFEIILDNECSCENVSRLLNKHGFKKEVKQNTKETIFEVSK